MIELVNISNGALFGSFSSSRLSAEQETWNLRVTEINSEQIQSVYQKLYSKNSNRNIKVRIYGSHACYRNFTEIINVQRSHTISDYAGIVYMRKKPINTLVITDNKESICLHQKPMKNWELCLFYLSNIKFMELLLSVNYKRLSKRCYILAWPKCVKMYTIWKTTARRLIT